MSRLSGRRREEAFALHTWLRGEYGVENPFSAALAHCRAQAKSRTPFDGWSLPRFTDYLELLAAHRNLETQPSSDGSKTYSVPTTLARRDKAADTLPRAIEAIKASASEHPVTIRQIEASGHKPQMIRTAVDVLLALGIVTATRYASATSITWDHRQEQALKSTADATAEYQQLMTDIGNLEKEAALLSEELQRIELNPMSSPREPPAYAVRFQE